MEEIIAKEEFDKLMELKGEMRGFAIKPILDFVLKEEGKDGFEKFKKTMTKLGSSIDLGDIKILEFYPLSWHAIILVVIQKIFGYDAEKFQEAGKFSAKAPFTIRRFVMQAILRLPTKKITEETEKIWRKFSTVGNLKIVNLDNEKREFVMRFENFECHPIMCQIVIGYFQTIAEMLTGEKPICEQISAVHKGDDCDDFLIKW